jgi:predicted transcriptional regulator
MNSTEVIKRLTKNGQSPVGTIRLLDQLHQQPRKAAAIADQNEIAVNTVYRSLDPFEEIGLVDKNEEKYRINGAGAVLVSSFNSATTEIRREDISFIVSSENRLYILNQFWNQQDRILRLNDFNGDAPARSTIERIMGGFEQRGWVAENTSQAYTLTIDGERVMRTYRRLSLSIDQTIVKIPCLRNIGVECQGLPVDALEGERMVVANPSRPFHSRRAHIRFVDQIDETNVEYVRGFAKYHDQEVSNMIIPFVENGAQFDCVSEKEAFHQAISELNDSTASKPWKFVTNFRWKVSPKSLPMGMLIFDDRWVVFGPADLGNMSEVSGVIFAADERVVQWAIELRCSECAVATGEQ